MRYALAVFDEWAQERGILHLDQLSRAVVGEWFDALLDGRKVSSARIYTEDVLRFWRWAYEDEELEAHCPKPRRLDLPPVIRAETRAPRWDEMDACVLAAGDDWRAPALMLMRCTGLRVGQVAALEWRDLDLEHATMHVRVGKSQQEKRGRVVPIAPVLVEYLAGLGRREGRVVEVPPSRTKRLLHADDAALYWRLAGVRPEVWVQPCHAFRKGLQSELKRSGADVEAVEYLVGHSLKLRGVYVESDALPLREAVALVPPLNRGPVVALPQRRDAQS